MQKNKEPKIFEKLVKRNYKNELEEVLEKKYFGENAKSLLLEILYKIETAYKDYDEVKVDAKTKDAYIEGFIEIIKNKCKSIRIVKPNSEQSRVLENKTFLVKKEKGEIICLPIARKLLYAISKLDKKDIIVNKKYSLITTTMSSLINAGDNINNVEPLRDFNGWSWTTLATEYESVEYNLVYQILLILVGSKFLEKWIKNVDSKEDFIEKLENKLKREFGIKNAKEIIYYIYKISVILEIKIDPDILKKIMSAQKKVNKELAKYEDKQAYIKRLTIKKNKLSNEIRRIDTIVSSKELLQEEYIKRNNVLPLDEKIFSMRVLAQIMMEEREKLFKEMVNCNLILKPKNFLARKEELEKEKQILDLADIKDNELELKESLIKLQKVFLECLKIRVQKLETKQEIINSIYQIRYYSLLPFSLNENIFNLPELKNSLKEVYNEIIIKAIHSKVMNNISHNEILRYEILKNLFVLRIINLSEAYIKITKENEKYYVQFYDGKTIDRKFAIKTTINKKDLTHRINKKIKLFE